MRFARFCHTPGTVLWFGSPAFLESRADFFSNESLIYKIIWVAGIFAGSLAELKFIWNIADILNGLMSIPNIVAVLLLSGVIASETKKYAGKQFWLCLFNKNFCLQKRKNAKACRKAYDGARQNIRQKMVSAQHAQDHSQNAKKERGAEQGLLIF